MLPAVVANSTKPKPRKSEIVAAMALVKYQQLIEENNAKHETANKLGEKAKAAILKYVLANIGKLTPLVNTGYRSGDSFSNVSVEFRINSDAMPEGILTLLHAQVEASNKCEYRGNITLQSVTKNIRDKLAEQAGKSERIKALTETPAVRKAIVKMLDELDSPAVAA